MGDSLHESNKPRGPSQPDERDLQVPQFPGIELVGDSVTILGVQLKRCDGGNRTPDIKDYLTDVLTDFDLELMQQIAVSWDIGTVPCIEGGSGIGKTQTISRLAALLNQQLFKQGCHEEVTPEVLFGRRGPKEGTRTGLGFNPGIGTEAITEGGILFLDEFNALPEETQIRLRELIDCVNNGKQYFTLSEDEGQRIKIHPDFRIVLAQNDPLSGSRDVRPLNEPDLGRVAYFKHPEELPEAVLRDRFLGQLQEIVTVTAPARLHLEPTADFGLDKLGELLGSLELKEEYYQQYRKFVSDFSELVRTHAVGRDQGQPIYLDWERETIRVLTFVTRYHEVDLDDTTQRALRFFFKNKLADPDERAQVEELIRKFHVEIGDDPERIRLEPVERPIFVTKPGGRENPTFVPGGISTFDAMIQERLLSLPIGRGELVLGRSPKNPGYPEGEIVVDKAAVSRQHCLIKRNTRTSFFVQDLDSRNGTWVNGVKVSEAIVHPGDQISLLGDMAAGTTFTVPSPPGENLENAIILRPDDIGLGTLASFRDAEAEVTAPREVEPFNPGSIVVSMERDPFDEGEDSGKKLSAAGPNLLEHEPVQGIRTHPDYISFMGVRLDRAGGGDRTDDVRRFSKDVLTEFDLRLMQQLAICWDLGQVPILEGGPGIGKSRTADRMAAFLNREMYYFLCRDCSSKLLFGRLGPSESGTTSGFDFVPGSGAHAIENGGVLFLDEFTASTRQFRERILNLVDILNTRARDRAEGRLNGEYLFDLNAEGRQEPLRVHPDFSLVIAQNEASGNDPYLSPINDVLFNRTFYIKLPDALPESVAKARFLGRLGVAPEVNLGHFELLSTDKQMSFLDLIRSQADDPARRTWFIQEVFKVYRGFTKQIDDHLRSGELAANRQQRVYLNPERQRQRVEHFMGRYYNGDFLSSFRRSILHNFSLLFESQDERQLVRDLLEGELHRSPELLRYARSLRQANRR